MKNACKIFVTALFACVLFPSCEKVDAPSGQVTADEELVTLEEVARLLASAPLGEDRMGEVLDAVTASGQNGYDEEYMLSDLLSSPGRGVGEQMLKSSVSPRGEYSRPLRDLFSDYFEMKASGTVKSGNDSTAGVAGVSAEQYMNYLSSSDMQIYWPDSGEWDGKESPVVTFAPEDESASSNVGWFMDEDGQVRQITVDEQTAMTRPVWVVNRNDDSPFVSLEVMKKNNPDWEEGGHIEISSAVRGTSASKGRMLVLKNFKMLRHYDSWLRGASEFFIRTGAVSSFTASTEAEMKLYDPQITDFMVVVKRKELNVDKELGVVLVSDWTEQLDDCAFMVVEDDGGTVTSWSCSATVKIKSKSYGFDISLPLKSYDDIVWRGKLSRKYLDSADVITGRFGDTELTFASVEY